MARVTKGDEMDGILELETEGQAEELRRRFPSAVAIEKTDWANIWMIVHEGNRTWDVTARFAQCTEDLWLE